MQNQNQNNAQEDVPQQTTHSIKEKLRAEYYIYILRLYADMNADVDHCSFPFGVIYCQQ